MKQNDFHAALKFASHAAATKDIRYYLNGVLFEFTDAGLLRMVATDGHRMAVAQCVPTFGLPAQQIIVKGDDVKLLLTLAKPLKNYPKAEVTFTWDNGQLVIAGAMGGWRHACTPVDGKYPDWRRVSREQETAKPQRQINVNADYLADACKACGALGDKYAGVTFTTYGDECRSFRVTPFSIKPDGIEAAYVVIMPMRK